MLRAAAAIFAVAFAALPAAAGAPPLIPRDVFFRDPTNTSPAISPDARRVAYLAPSNGVSSIWVRTIGLLDAKPVASDPGRPISGFLWQGDSRHIFYLRDKAGNGNTHVIVVNVLTGDARDLTPDPGLRANIEDVDPAVPDTILISTNERDKARFDVYRLDLKHATLVLEEKNPGNVDEWFVDNEFFVRAAIVRGEDGSSTIEVRDGALAPWRTLVTFGPDDAFTDPIAFSADDRSLYAIDAKDSPTARLVRYDLATGAAEPLAADPSSDVTSAFVDPRTHNVVAAAVERERVEWTVTDPNYAADFAALGHVRAGGIEIPSASADGRTWIVGFSTDDGAEAYYSYDRTTKAAAPLFFSAPELAGLALSRMQPISLLARDGLQLHGYLTLPAGVDPRGLPTVLLVHGGPWARDRFGYSGIVQWLANRGYAVLQVNFRGSTGYGRAFENAGDRQWAGGMRTDLLDARDWVVKAGFADPARVAIVGESYGGYAVLAALATTPSAFACGVDIAGLSDLGSVSAAVAKEPSAVRDIYARRMGDDAAALRAESPLYLAANISAPLLVGQGQNDLRVPIRNTDRLVATVRAKKIPVSYVVFPDEGHGFVHPANNLRFNALLEEFLARYLGGRAERAHAGEALDSLMR